MMKTGKTVAKERKWIAELGVLFFAAVFLLFCKNEAFATENHGQDFLYEWYQPQSPDEFPKTGDQSLDTDTDWYPILMNWDDYYIAYTASDPWGTDIDNINNDTISLSRLDPYKPFALYDKDFNIVRISGGITGYKINQIGFPVDQVKNGLISFEDYGAVLIKYAGKDFEGHDRYYLRTNDNGKPGNVIFHGISMPGGSAGDRYHAIGVLGLKDFRQNSVKGIDGTDFNHCSIQTETYWNLKWNWSELGYYAKDLATWRFDHAGGNGYHVVTGGTYYDAGMKQEGNKLVPVGKEHTLTSMGGYWDDYWALYRVKDKQLGVGNIDMCVVTTHHEGSGDTLGVTLARKIPMDRIYEKKVTVTNKQNLRIGTADGYSFIDSDTWIEVQAGGTLTLRGNVIMCGNINCKGDLVLTPGTNLLIYSSSQSPAITVGGSIIVPPNAGIYVCNNKTHPYETFLINARSNEGTDAGAIYNGGIVITGHGGVSLSSNGYIYNKGTFSIGRSINPYMDTTTYPGDMNAIRKSAFSRYFWSILQDAKKASAKNGSYSDFAGSQASNHLELRDRARIYNMTSKFDLYNVDAKFSGSSFLEGTNDFTQEGSTKINNQTGEKDYKYLDPQ